MIEFSDINEVWNIKENDTNIKSKSKNNLNEKFQKIETNDNHNLSLNHIKSCKKCYKKLETFFNSKKNNTKETFVAKNTEHFNLGEYIKKNRVLLLIIFGTIFLVLLLYILLKDNKKSNNFMPPVASENLSKYIVLPREVISNYIHK